MPVQEVANLKSQAVNPEPLTTKSYPATRHEQRG